MWIDGICRTAQGDDDNYRNSWEQSRRSVVTRAIIILMQKIKFDAAAAAGGGRVASLHIYLSVTCNDCIANLTANVR